MKDNKMKLISVIKPTYEAEIQRNSDEKEAKPKLKSTANPSKQRNS